MDSLRPVSDRQTVGNIGLYYVCDRLSRLGWNVMPTARNARGIDILIYSEYAKRKKTIQVKTLSRDGAVSLGESLNHLFGDSFVVCRQIMRETPECFVLRPKEVRHLAQRREKAGKTSFWLQARDYGTEKFREKWDRIGSGLFLIPAAPLPLSPPITPRGE
jgi:hypothetical protein